MVNCMKCGVPVNGKFCPQCGSKMEATCNSCNKVITDGKIYDIGTIIVMLIWISIYIKNTQFLLF